MFVRQIADASTLTRDPVRERQWTRQFFLVWIGIVSFRLLLLALSPLELSGDEAYYWEWGRQLDWGYFSKPPLIGWLMGFFGWASDHSTFGIRIGALLFANAALIPLFYTGRAMFNAEAGFWAAVALAFTPGNAAASFFFTIDAPLVFSWCLSMWATWHLFNAKEWSWRTGLVLTGSLGLGVLSKQMMLVFPLLAVLHLFFEPRHRHWLGARGWWLCVLGGILALVPPLLWNWHHDWITVSHTTGTNMQSPPVEWFKHLQRFFEFVGIQMVLLGPVIYGVMMWLLIRSFRAWGRLQPAERFLWMFSAPALLVFFVVALKLRALPNWPAVYYPAAFLLLGGWGAGQFSCARIHHFGRGIFRFGLSIGILLTLCVHLAMFIIPTSGFELNQKAPLRRLQGWSDYAGQVAAVEAREFGDRPHFILVVGHRYEASELAFYHPARPTVYIWNDSGHPQSQYDLWPGPETAEADEGLVVVPRKGSDHTGELPNELKTFFTEIQPLGDITIMLSTHDSRTYSLYRGIRPEGIHP